MGFFEFLSAQDAPAQAFKPGAKKGRRPQEEADPFSYSADEGPSLEAGKQGSYEGPSNPLTVKVQKAHLDIQDAYGDAVKALDSAINTPVNAPGSEGPLGEPLDLRSPDDLNHLRKVRDRAGNRDNAVRLSDDLQELGSRLRDPNLITAAQKMSRAAKAQLELQELKQPGQPLSVTPQEVDAHRQKLEQRQSQLQEQLKTSGDLRTPMLRKQLQETTKELVRIQEQPGAQSPDGRFSVTGGMADRETEPQRVGMPPPSVGEKGEGPFTFYLKGLGVVKTMKDMGVKVHQALRKVGVPEPQWGERVNPGAGVLRAASALDPDGILANLLAQDMERAKAEDAGDREKQTITGGSERDPRITQLEGRIESREMRLRQLYSDLHQSPFMQSWPGVVLYVLTALLTGNPKFAAQLVTGVNKDAAGQEMNGVMRELGILERRFQHYENQEESSRKEALSRMRRAKDEQSSRLWQLGLMDLNHRNIIARARQNGNPRAEKIESLNAAFRRTTVLASKAEKEMQDDLAPKSEKDAARSKYNIYMDRAQQLDLDILREESEK